MTPPTHTHTHTYHTYSQEAHTNWTKEWEKWKSNRTNDESSKWSCYSLKLNTKQPDRFALPGGGQVLEAKPWKKGLVHFNQDDQPRSLSNT